MPYKIIPQPKRKWEVVNERTGRITANNTTLTKAKKQICNISQQIIDETG